MSHPAKVLWGEGLYLRPQHFQQCDAYHESRLRELSHTLHPYAWGIRDLKIDDVGLKQNIVRLEQISAVFPDAEFYSTLQGDPPPEALPLVDLPSGTNELLIYLALPRLEPRNGNLDDPEKSSTPGRYSRHSAQALDLFTDATAGEVVSLRPVVRLLIENQPSESFEMLPLICLRRTSNSGFEIVTKYMAPSTTIEAAPQLLKDLRHLIESLQAKVQALHATHREPSQGVIEFRAGDIASFWLLHTSNTACASLNHLLHHPTLHPERLYQELLRLAGSLMTFSKCHQLTDLAPYDHANPGPAFNDTFEIIRTLIDTVISARYFSIALTQVKVAYYQGRIEGQLIDDNASLYLGVTADTAGVELAEAVPRTFKIASPDTVENLVRGSLPGIVLTYLQHVPTAIPVRPGMLYFAIEPRGPLYEQMIKGQTVTIFVPNNFTDLKLELIALTS